MTKLMSNDPQGTPNYLFLLVCFGIPILIMVAICFASKSAKKVAVPIKVKKS